MQIQVKETFDAAENKPFVYAVPSVSFSQFYDTIRKNT